MKKQVVVPPSKSITHRAIICAALAKGVSKVKNPLRSEDILCTRECMESLGATIIEKEEGLEIRGINNLEISSPLLELDVGESGTTCRLITPVAAAFKGISARIYGRGRMHERPVDELASALEKLGIDFVWEGKHGCPPYILRGDGLKGGRVEITLEKSSQFLSGLLLASPLAREQVVIEIGGEKVVSWPYVGLTLEVMEAFGVEVLVEMKDGSGGWIHINLREMRQITPGAVRFVIYPSSYSRCDFEVEGDWSNASYFVAAGLLLDEGLTISGINRFSLQGDKKILDILEKMGAHMEWKGDKLVTYPSLLHGIEVDMGDCPDLVPTVATMASMAEGKTIIKGVAHLTLKESNRLIGVANEIKKTGAEVEVFDDGLSITPGPPVKDRTFSFNTYGDHRMAMSLSLYQLAGAHISLDNKKCVSKSFPEFFDVWEKLIS